MASTAPPLRFNPDDLVSAGNGWWAVDPTQARPAPPGAPTIPPAQLARLTISGEEWEKRMAAPVVSKSDMNKLIMDYLMIEGYRSAAEEFAREADIPSDQQPDFDGIASRMAVRDAVARGDVVEAIERVNDLNPEILDTNKTLYFHLQQQRLIEYIRAGAIEDALTFAQQELAQRGEENPEFLSELERTMALLAFEYPPVPTSTGSGSGEPELLSQGQRARTARELNAAILNSLSLGPEPKLTSLLRLMAWGEALLGERAEFPRFELPVEDAI